MQILKQWKTEPEKWLFRILLVVFIASMVPVLYLSRYGFPNCDDFTYGLETHRVWNATHSFGEVLKTALAVTKETWQLWQGTWFSIFLMTLMPGVFGEKWYFLTTLLMAGMLGGGICVLMHTVLCRYISRAKENRYLRGICTLTVLFLTFQTFVSPVLALYWYNGSLHYVFMEAVLFFAVSALLCLETSEQKSKKILWMILSAVLCALLGGANLLTGLQSVILIVLLTAWEFFRKKKNRFWFLFPLVCSLVGFAFNVLAPGNLIREDTAESMGAVKAIVMSFYWGIVYVTEWLTPMVLVGFAMLIPAIYRLAKQAEGKFLKPLYAVFLSFCVFCAMFTPTLYATSSEGPDRCKNVMRVVLYLLVFFNLLNGCGWAWQLKQPGQRKQSEQHSQSRPGFFYRLLELLEETKSAFYAVTLIAMGVIFLFAADKNTYTSVSAVRSILNGEAAEYAAENNERLELYTNGEPEITISPLSVEPYLLYIDDVTNEGDRGYWLNLALMDYYGKDRITVSEPEE